MPCEYVSVSSSTNSASSNRSISRSIARATCCVVHAVHAADELQDLAAGKLVVKKRLIGHVADQRDGVARLRHDVVTADANGAAAGPNQADEHFDGRGFAGAVVAEQRVELAAVHAQVQILDRDLIAVRSVDLLKFDHRAEACGAV